MTAEEAAEWGKPLSFEKVWATPAETDRKYAETAEITGGLPAQPERNIDRVSNNPGGLNQRSGSQIETVYNFPVFL
jgi:hypothetical protein